MSLSVLPDLIVARMNLAINTHGIRLLYQFSSFTGGVKSLRDERTAIIKSQEVERSCALQHVWPRDQDGR